MKTRFVVGHLADVGRERDHQEDAYSFQLNPPGPDASLHKGAIFIVADGVGGYQAGELASRMAVSLVPEHYYADPGDDVIESLRQAMIAANVAIHEVAQTPGQEKMATTVVCAVVQDDHLFVGHAGDSRAYLLCNSELSLLTQDHSWVAEQVRKKLIREEDAVAHPQRNVITRSLGSMPQIEPEVQHVGPLSDGVRFLLCTDGLYDGVDAKRIKETLKQYPPQQACQRFVNLANAAGGSDNIAVVVVEVHLELDGPTHPPPSKVVHAVSAIPDVALAEREHDLEVRYRELTERKQRPANLAEREKALRDGEQQIALAQARLDQQRIAEASKPLVPERVIQQWECEICYRFPDPPSPRTIRLGDGRMVKCGLVILGSGEQPPTEIGVWASVGSRRAWHTLLAYGAQDNWIARSDIIQNRKPVLIFTGDEIVNLQIAQLPIYAAVTQCEFAPKGSCEGMAFQALSVSFRVQVEV